MSYRSLYPVYHEKPVTVQSLLNDVLSEAAEALNTKMGKVRTAIIEAAKEADRETLQYITHRYGDQHVSPSGESEVGKLVEEAQFPLKRQQEALFAAYEKTSITLGLGRGKDAEAKLAIIEEFKSEVKKLIGELTA